MGTSNCKVTSALATKRANPYFAWPSCY